MQAITEWCADARGPGHPCTHPPAFLPLRFSEQNRNPPEGRLLSTDKCMKEHRCTHQMSHQDLGWVLQWGQDHGQMRWYLQAALSPSSSPDCGFKGDRSSVSTCSSVSSRSDRSGSSRCTHCGQCCGEPGDHMKINLPVFKDEDAKDAVTYQSWC